MREADLVIAAVFGGMGFFFVFITLTFIGRILRGRKLSYPDKTASYECGEIPVGDAWLRFNPRFFLLAIVFIIFDVEIAFLFPWGVVFRTGGGLAFADMLLFLAILLVGYLWFWKIGELRWILPPGKVGKRS